MIKDLSKKEMKVEITSLNEDIMLLESVIKNLHEELISTFDLTEVLLNRLKSCEEIKHNIKAIIEGA